MVHELLGKALHMLYCVSMTRQDVLQLYPDVDINEGSGADRFQEEKPITERTNIAVIIKHPTEERYLLAHWKSSDWNGFLTGGVEEGDTVVETVHKEVLEETGYKNVASVQPMDCVSRGLFYHPVKQVNRLAHYHLVYVELGDLEQEEISEEEKAIAEFRWIDKDKVEGTLTREDMKILWRFYISH